MASHSDDTKVDSQSVDTTTAAAAISSTLRSPGGVSSSSASTPSSAVIPVLYRRRWIEQFEKLITHELRSGDKSEDEYLSLGIPEVITMSVLDFHESRRIGTRDWSDFIDAILYCAVISYERRQSKLKALFRSKELWHRIDDYHSGVLTVPKGMRSSGSIIAMIDRLTLQVIPGLQFPELSEIHVDHGYQADSDGVFKKEKSPNFVPFKLVFDLERGITEEQGWSNVYAFGRYYTVQYVSDDRVIALGTYDKTRFLYLRKNDFFIVVCGLTLSINDPRCFHSAPSARNYLPLVCDALKFT